VKLVATALGVLLLVLMPLAHGSPIDPSTPGFWDNGDFDDVILLLTSELHFLESEDPPPIRVSESVSEAVIEYPADAVAQHTHETGTPRAPPFAFGTPGQDGEPTILNAEVVPCFRNSPLRSHCS
jgi:hypothetical protein